MLQEQQNVISYVNNQNNVSQLSNELTQVSSMVSTYTNNDAGYQNWLSNYGVGGASSPFGTGVGTPGTMAYTNGYQAYQSWLANNNFPGQVSAIQQQINSANTGENNAQNTMIQGYTLPGVNAQGALGAEQTYIYGPNNGQPVTGANEGAINATLDPLVADAYRTRYVASQGLNEQMNQSGNLNSGAQVGSQQKVGQQTMGQLSNDSNQLYNQGANQMTSLANNLSGVQQQEGQQVAQTQQNQTGGQFLNSANTNQNNWLSNFNTGISQNLNTQNTSFNQGLANQQPVSSALGSVANVISNAL